MSHWDSDLDHHDHLGGPYTRPNAVCPECKTEFYRNREDTGPLCDECCRLRDRRLERAARALQRVREKE